MTKKIIALLFAVILCLSMMVSASAYTEDYIIDTESVFTSSELNELGSQAQVIENNYGIAVVFCIISETDGMSTTEFCEASYDALTESPDGIVIAHNIADNVYSWYCAGQAERIFTESVLDNMMTLYNENDSYFGGVKAVYTMADNVLKSAPLLNGSSATEKSTEKSTEKQTEATEPTTEFQRVERTLPLVVDRAELLSDEEEKALLARCEAFTSEHKMEIAIVTVTDFEGKDYETYGDDFYNNNGYGYGDKDDGILVLFKPGAEGERALYITTHGKGYTEFFDTIREEMYAAMKPLIVEKKYNDAFNIFLDKAEETMKPNVSPIWLFVFLLFGATGGMLVTMKMTSKNYSVYKRDAQRYARPGSLVLNQDRQYESFLYSNTKKVAKVKSSDDNDRSSGGSRSSTHKSASGRTHGGTGGTF